MIGGAFARGRGLRLGCVLVGVPLIALALVPNAVAALAFLAILGAGYALVEVAGLTLLQRLADDAVRARAFAVVESSYWLTTGAGAMLAPLVIARRGPARSARDRRRRAPAARARSPHPRGGRTRSTAPTASMRAYPCDHEHRR